MSHSDETMLKGIGVSPGIVISSARVLRSDISANFYSCNFF